MKLEDLKNMPVKASLWEQFDSYEDAEIGKIGNYVVKRASGFREGKNNPFNISFREEDYFEEAEETGKSMRELAVEDAKLHAKFYQSLVDEGIYHPDTQFGVCADNEGNPTMFAIMPYMDKTVFSMQEGISEVANEQARVVRDDNREWFTEKYKTETYKDFGTGWNYREADDRNIYWIDLHLFNELNLIRMPEHVKEIFLRENK